jgi:hypothetical protein
MKKVLHALLYVALFIFSFALFLFITFPYEVLKESLSAEISQQSGMQVRIGEMGASLPLGLKAKDIKIENGPSSLALKSLSANVSVFSLLLGKVRAQAGVEAGQGASMGDMEVGVDFGILDLIKGEQTPRHLSFIAHGFPIEPVVSFALMQAANAPGANPMVAPLLSALGVAGALNSKIEMDLDSKNPTQSSGSMDVSFNKAILKLSHPSLGLPDQEFKRAGIKAKVEGGKLMIDKASGFFADEIELAIPKGEVTLKADPTASLLDVTLGLQLNKGLKEKFGFIIDAIVGNAASDGKLTVQIRGPMGAPTVQTF